jgi:hypothetical protein
MTFPTTTPPTISNNEVFPPNIATALNTLASEVIADLNTLAGVTPEDSPAPFTARGVALSLHAYNGSGTGTLTSTANGTFASQNNIDGLTVAVGDQIFIPAGLSNVTAVDSGPWVVKSLGASGAKWQLARPAWWSHGSSWTSGQSVHIGGEGAIYSGTTWVATAAAGVIDTTDSAFYCREITFQVTLVSATQALAAAQPSPIADYPLTGSTAGAHSCPIGIMPVPSAGTLAAGPQVFCSLASKAGSATLTVGYGIIAEPTPGYVGTAAVTVNAIAAGQTVSGDADTSTINVTIRNPC